MTIKDLLALLEMFPEETPVTIFSNEFSNKHFDIVKVTYEVEPESDGKVILSPG